MDRSKLKRRALKRGRLYRAPDSAIVAEVELLQWYRRTRPRTEVVVERVVPHHRVRLRLRLFGRLNPDIAVAIQTGAGRDQLAQDHVLLEPDQRIRLALDSSVGQHLGGLLEGGRRQPRLGSQ